MEEIIFYCFVNKRTALSLRVFGVFVLVALAASMLSFSSYTVITIISSSRWSVATDLFFTVTMPYMTSDTKVQFVVCNFVHWKWRFDNFSSI